VDLGGALRLLAQRHRVRGVRVDAGGGLSAALLRAGLTDQLSIVIAPYLAASAITGPARLLTGPGCRDAVALDLTAVERLRQGHVWLRYDVRKGPDPGLSRVDPAAKSGFPGGLADVRRLLIPPRRPPC
jgi:riboflavin biosynthesis pyrimidine reductase